MGTRSSLQNDLISKNIKALSAFYLTDGDNQWIQRIIHTGNDCLNFCDDISGSQNRINTLMRGGTMRRNTLDFNSEIVTACHTWAGFKIHIRCIQLSPVCALLALVAVGCLALVTTGVYQGAMEQLLEEGDYTRPQKKHHKLRGTVTMIYWLAATAVFLLYTYGPNGNGQPQYSWIIWAVAGVLYAAVMGIVRIISRSRG